MRYKGKYLFTIGPEHVGQTYVQVPCTRSEHCAACKPAQYALGSVLGSVLAVDIGKQVFDVNGVLSVESNEQRDARRAREGAG